LTLQEPVTMKTPKLSTPEPLANGRPVEDLLASDAPIETPVAAPDPFDVERLRLAHTDPTAIGVEELLTEVRYKKPTKDAFFRVHPSPSYTARVGIIDLSGRDESYFVDPTLWAALAGEKTFGFRQLYT